MSAAQVAARAALVPLLAEPSLRAEQVSQLVLGETATVQDTSGEWRRVRCELDGYLGWVPDSRAWQSRHRVIPRKLQIRQMNVPQRAQG